MARAEILQAEAVKQREERYLRKEVDRLFFMSTSHLDAKSLRYLELREDDALNKLEQISKNAAAASEDATRSSLQVRLPGDEGCDENKLEIISKNAAAASDNAIRSNL